MRMTLPAGVLLLVALAGCDRQPPQARAAPAVVASPLDDIPDGSAPPMTIKPSFQCPKPVVEGEPILPLDTPLTELQKLICDEPELALLDGHVHAAYLAARLRTGVDRSGLSKAERQWKADLDSCLKAADPRDCVAEASRTRLVELALQDPATVARTQLEFTCKGTATPLTAAFYGGLDPAFAVLGFGREQAIVFVQPTHAGLKYGRTGVDFFVRQGQVKAEFYGRTLACVSPTWRPAEMSASVPDTEAMAALVEQTATPAPTTLPAPLPEPAPSADVATAPSVVAQAQDASAKPAVSPASAPTRASASVTAPMTVTADPSAAAPIQRRAPPTPMPMPPAPLRSPASAKMTASTDAAAQAISPQVRHAAPPAPVPKAQAPVRSATSTKVPATAVTAAAQVPVKQVTPPASPLSAPAVSLSPRSSVAGTLAAAPATDALVPQAIAPAPSASVPSSTATGAAAIARAKVNLKASQATDALVRQVVAQAQNVPAPSGATPASPMDVQPGKSKVSPAAVEAKP